MVDDPGPREPMDPYRPPPPGHPHSYPPWAGAPQPAKRSSAPLWWGMLLGLLLTGGLAWWGLMQPDLGPWLALGLLLLIIVLLLIPQTRRWGVGLLIGAVVSVPVGLIVFAGVCIVLMAQYSGGGT